MMLIFLSSIFELEMFMIGDGDANRSGRVRFYLNINVIFSKIKSHEHIVKRFSTNETSCRSGIQGHLWKHGSQQKMTL